MNDIYDVFPIYGQESEFKIINRTILENDSMLDSTAEGSNSDILLRTRYFSVGASAISVIKEAIHAHGKELYEVKSIMDYACGFGRVHRWLRATFPSAAVSGVDADAASVEGARELGFDASTLDLSLTQDLGVFDLIWVGSLFTHLSYDESVRTMRYLRRQLSSDGILIVTMHGVDVVDKIVSRSVNYGLDSNGISHLAETYLSSGWGYADYPDQDGYGISVSRPDIALKLLPDCGLNPFFFRAKGWDRHQDVYACTPNERV